MNAANTWTDSLAFRIADIGDWLLRVERVSSPVRPFAWHSANSAHFSARRHGYQLRWRNMRSLSRRDLLVEVQPAAPAPVETCVEYPFLMLPQLAGVDVADGFSAPWAAGAA